ncbi:crotonobetaine/carnitine-CoA ligase [Cellulomonas hominis]
MDVVDGRTLRDLWGDLARESGERTFLVFEDRAGSVVQYTYAQFAASIHRTANLFRSLGVRQGDAVAVHLNNCPELLQCLFAVAEIGAVLVPLHPRSTLDECADVIGRVGALVVVCERPGLELYGRGAGRIDVPHVLVAREPGRLAEPGVLRFEQSRDAHPAELVDPVPLSADDVAGIVFTSGTTARPKGVVLTHENLLFSGRFVAWQARLTADDRLLTTMPACHVNFQLNALMPVLHAGATLVAVERYSASRFWHQVRHYGATVVQGIAMIVRTLLLQPVAAGERDHHVRDILYYLPISDAEKERFEERFAVRLLNSYGTSEMLVGVLTDPPEGERRWPAVGQVGPGYEARVADEAGQELPPHTVGEIQVRGEPGRTLMKEYFQDPDATTRLYDADGWMHTGDLGYVDADGWYDFLDRRTNLIKRAGENVSPAEVEALLARHPDIVEAAVVGVPDPIHDEAVKAVVVLAAGATTTAQEIQDYCCTRLARFKVPTIVEIVDALPRTSSFKVATSDLR